MRKTISTPAPSRRDLARLVAMPTESQNPERAPVLAAVSRNGDAPLLEKLGFTCRILNHPRAKGPFLFAQRIEDPSLPTIFGYGHGDVIRGLDAQWSEGLSPWTLTERGDRWYGRGVVDNKGQHVININALRAVLETRGKLGFNAKYLIEMGEECGSPGLRELCTEQAELFKADVLIGSDGPRLNAERPTVFLGSRGGVTFDLTINAREGGHHSGNWGGILSDPAIQLAHAIASIASPTGQIRIHEWVPKELPAPVRKALADCEIDGGPDGPTIDPNWGEPGLSPAEQVFGWCSFDVLAMKSGVPETPGQRRAAERLGALPAPLRRRHRPERRAAGAAPPSQAPRLRHGRGHARARRDLQRDPPRSRGCLGALGAGLDRQEHQQEAGAAAQSRRLAAQRHLLGDPRHAHDLGAAFLSRLLAACARRAPARRDRPRGAAA